MKVNAQGRPVQGSFGIPEELEQAAMKSKQQPTEPAKPVEQPNTTTTTTKEENTIVDDILKDLGIEFTSEDFQKYIFRGSIEKEVVIVKGYLKAKFRSLIGKEWDEIDEILAGETKDIPMTVQGMDIRKSVLVLSYGILELEGKLLSKVIKLNDTELDTKAMALERRKALLRLAPSVTNIMIEKHGALTMVLNNITRDPGTHIKNS